MSMSHEEFLAYLDSIDSAKLDKDDNEKLKLVIAMADKLRQDFNHLANYIRAETGSEFLGSPVLDNMTDYFADEYGGSEKDGEVHESIQGFMQNVSLEAAFLDVDFHDNAEPRYIIKAEAVRLLHEHGFKIYIHQEIYRVDPDLLYHVYIDTGDLLMKLYMRARVRRPI